MSNLMGSHAGVKPLGYRQAVTLMTMVCRQCHAEGRRGNELPCFSTALCERYGAAPVYAVPQWRNRLRGLVIGHYKAAHPQWRVS